MNELHDILNVFFSKLIDSRMWKELEGKLTEERARCDVKIIVTKIRE